MIRRPFQRLRRLISSPSGAGHALPTAPTYRDWWNASSVTMEAAYASTIAPTTESEYRSRGWNGDDNSLGARHLIERAGLGAESRVLEIGCGIARIGREMAPHVKEWHGADISPNMIALARQRTSHLPNVVFHELDGVGGLSRLPAGRFDFVYATIVLMHLDKEDLFEYLRQAHRLLDEGGCAYFDTWNILHPDVFRIWRQAARFGDNKPRGRIQCCTPDEFRLYLEEAGFAITSFDTEDRLVRAFCDRITGGPSPLENDGKAPFGYVGAPLNDTEVRGTIRVEGWCLDRVVRVEVRLGELPPAEAELGHAWPGVAELFPRYPERERCAFRCELDTTALPDGLHELRVTATDADGRQAPVTGFYWSLRVANSPSREP